jgi:hypothetical protein
MKIINDRDQAILLKCLTDNGKTVGVYVGAHSEENGANLVEVITAIPRNVQVIKDVKVEAPVKIEPTKVDVVMEVIPAKEEVKAESDPPVPAYVAPAMKKKEIVEPVEKPAKKSVTEPVEKHAKPGKVELQEKKPSASKKKK